MFIIIALVASIKSFFYLNLRVYGTFALPLLFITFSVFFVEYLPSRFISLNKSIIKKSFFVLIFGLAILYCWNVYFSFKNDMLIKTFRGDIYNPPFFVKSSKEAINYINENLLPKDSFLVMPEGIMLNFLTNHPSKSLYYVSVPSFVEAFGENKIINDLKKSPPDYVFLNNRDSSDWGPAYMCKDYGLKICKWIYKNYSKEKVFDNKGFKITVYKLKSP